MSDHAVQFIYILSAALFVLSLKWMRTPATARRGVFAGEIGMVLAIAGTLMRPEVVDYKLIVIAFVIGTVAGVPLAYLMPMTAVPQRTALSHAFGALAAALVGTAEYYRETPHGAVMIALVFETLLGFLTFTGSMMAVGKLQEILPTRPITYRGQNVPIGGADMPTVIALLNSYAGLSAAAMGFALGNRLLIIAGALDGSSGFILSVIMCRAMNRSFTNVLFGAFGQVRKKAGAEEEQRRVHSATAEDAAQILDAARSVIVVPGYGLAVAQAQHKLRELYDALARRGVDVRFAMHPVAGRMPGHMNVLLAEADIPYDRLFDMDDINSEFAQADAALVIGANDVTNPAARSDESSPIYGMPILAVDRARTVMVIKRSMSPGFAGIDNPLYYMDKTLMLFGDAKAFVTELVKELAEVAKAA
jgi:NAD(P) transhydrogenase subunit beta